MMSKTCFKLFTACFPIIFVACGDSDSGNSQNAGGSGRSLQAEVILTVPENIRESFHTTGTLIPAEEVSIKSEIAGRLVSIHFEEGQWVSKGTLLFSIDDRDYQAELARIHVQLELARKEKQRNEQLFRDQAVSQEAMDASIGKVAELESQAQLLEVRISRCRVSAPFPGKLGLRKVSPGAFVAVGQELVDLAQTNPIKVEFEVPEKLSRQVSDGMTIHVVVEESRDTFEAKVYAADSKIDAGSRNLRLRAVAENSQSRLVPGTFVKVLLELAEIKDAIMLPTEAVVPELNAEKVFVVEGGKVATRVIRTGIRTENRIQVIDGLKAGDSVMITGILQAREGMPVNAKIIVPGS